MAVLIADDEPAIRKYLKHILRDEQIQILEAGDAAQTLQTVQQLSGQVGLVITDIQMPGDMDGVDLAYSIRNSFPEIPIILISGHADKAPACFPFIRKPFTSQVVLEAVHKAIAAAAGQGETKSLDTHGF
jgi:DNA-binding NtrC family response regulator